MAMMIREFVDGNNFYSQTNDYNEKLNVTEGDNSVRIDPDSLMVDIEAIHAYPHITRNYTRYMPKCLRESVPTWTQPYLRPLIKHHNESNGDIIGRVFHAEYKTKNTLSGTPALLFTVNVPNKQAKEDIQSGLLDTVSIGVIANDVRCSICGQQLAGGDMCEHERGVTYKVDGVDKVCTWDMYSIEAKEVSYVVVPSDMYAKNISISPAAKTKSKSNITESLDETIKKGDKKMAEPENKELALQEATAKVSELTAKVTELEEAKGKADAKVIELTEAKKTSDDKITELIKEKSALEAKVKESAQLKEALENAVAESKAQLKESMIETLQAMRVVSGKEKLGEDVVKARSEESIRDSIMDIKEELNKNSANGKNITESVEKVEDPTLNDGKDGIHKDIKESSEEEKIDLEAGMKNIFGDVFGGFNK